MVAIAAKVMNGDKLNVKSCQVAVEISPHFNRITTAIVQIVSTH